MRELSEFDLADAGRLELHATRLALSPERPRVERRRFSRRRGNRGGPALAEIRPQRSVYRRDRFYRRGLALADVTVAGAVAAGFALTRATSSSAAIIVLAVPLIVLLGKLAGLYDRDEIVLSKTTLDEGPALFQISGVFALVVGLFYEPMSSHSLTLVAVLWTGTCVALLCARAAARGMVRLWSPAERCLLIGAPMSLERLREKIIAARGVKADVVAQIALPQHSERFAHTDLAALFLQHNIHRVVIAPGESDGRDTIDLIRSAKASGIRVSVLPRLLQVLGSSVEFDHVDGLTLLGVRPFGLSRSSRLLKRAFDVVGSVLALVATAPFFALVSIWIRLDSSGPVFFRQIRVGRDGQRFWLLKFRSMVADADAQKDGLRHLNEASGLFKIAADPRITRAGRFLRATSLDELPQLINVLRGEMSLVGPRPLVTEEDVQVEGLDRSRLHLTPGMTGHWQILGSARIPLNEMVGIDYLYVANWSLWTDIKILLRTIPYVLGRGGM
jgi:exopolysaccharide biosynthesis polyprenyl glycosylphosphotransferase